MLDLAAEQQIAIVQSARPDDVAIVDVECGSAEEIGCACVAVTIRDQRRGNCAAGAMTE